MKTKIFLIFIITLLVIIVPTFAAICTDSDGGLNRYVKGVTQVYTKYIDECYPSDKLKEYICVKNTARYTILKNTVRYTILNCAYGCYDGACLNSPTPSLPISQPILPIICGDNKKQSIEECDLGIKNGIPCVSSYNSFCNYCDKSCKSIKVSRYCGDGIIDVNYEKCDDGNNLNNDGCNSECKIEEKKYYFEYPDNRKDGYYAVPCAFIPKDKKEFCSICLKDKRSCAGIIDNNNLYTINDNYTEDFTYQSSYPVYGSWEIKNFIDFREKCFVGDCNKNNLRHVICINNDLTITDEIFNCNKWKATYGSTATHYCINNSYFNSRTILKPDPRFDRIWSCSKPKTINFYYIYNDYNGYEGYSSTWKTRWQNNVDEINTVLSKYNINLQPNFYEYKLSDSSTIPSSIYDRVSKGFIMYKDGDIHVTITAGEKQPQDYGFACLTLPKKINPCSAHSGGNTIRIPDYYDITRKQGASTLIHELGHSLGCPHTGAPGSLSSHLYTNDIMSYGSNVNDFLYECRIVVWLLGRL